jgi:hypothetical protein
VNCWSSAFARRASARQPSRGLPSRSSRYGAASRERRLVSLNFASWNQLHGWLRQVDGLSGVACCDACDKRNT